MLFTKQQSARSMLQSLLDYTKVSYRYRTMHIEL